jgi:hypothetical protein
LVDVTTLRIQVAQAINLAAGSGIFAVVNELTDERGSNFRIAWVTGGASGMGRATAINLAEAGADVAVRTAYLAGTDFSGSCSLPSGIAGSNRK